jgi:ActR/RegA family two-component response regulator
MKKILWIDDNETLINQGIPIFQENGFQIFKATNTSRALSLLREEKLDGILLDVHLNGGENGLDLLQEIHHFYPDIKIVIFTGYPEYNDHITSGEKGATAYLAKISKSIPLNPKKQKDFFSALHKLFSGSETKSVDKGNNMSRATSAGMTDYSHQSLENILKDLENWSVTIKRIMLHLETQKQILITNGYWESANSDFKWIYARAFMLYTTALTEVFEIKEQLPVEVQNNHVTRLNHIGTTSYEINMEWGTVWHKEVNPKQYGDQNFKILEDLYAKSRDMAIDLMDLSNVAERLKDYVGRKGSIMHSDTSGTSINVNIGRDFSGNLVIGDENETNNDS